MNRNFIVTEVKTYNVDSSNLYRYGRELILKGYNDENINNLEKDGCPIKIALCMKSFLKERDKFITKVYKDKSGGLGRSVMGEISHFENGVIIVPVEGDYKKNVKHCKKVVVTHEKLPEEFFRDVVNNMISINRKVFIETNMFNKSEILLSNEGKISYSYYKESWRDVVDNLKYKTKELLVEEFDDKKFNQNIKYLIENFNVLEIIPNYISLGTDWTEYSNIFDNSFTSQALFTVMKKNYKLPTPKGL